MMKKQILCFVMCFVMTLSCLSGMTVTAASLKENGFTYTVTDGEATIVSYSDHNPTHVVLPDTLGGYPVTRIGDGAFAYCSQLEEIVIPNGVTYIGSLAFYNCALKSILLPDSVTYIGYEAFRGCLDLSDVVIPDSVEYIAGRAFYGTAFTGDESNYVNGAVYSGKHLIRVNVYQRQFTVKEGTKTIASGAFSYCEYMYKVSIPDSVVSIGDSAFSECSTLRSISIPDSVESIGSDVFSGCSSLTTIKLSQSIKSIGRYMFNNCSSLQEVVIPDSVTSIAAYAFSNCLSLKSVSIPKSVTSIDRQMLDGTYGSAQAIYYEGTREEWKAIVPGYLIYCPVVHYNTTKEHWRLDRIISRAGDTCLQQGLAQYSCECGYTHSDTLRKDLHSFEAVTQAATMVPDWDWEGKPIYLMRYGVTKLTCTTCGYECQEYYTFPDVRDSAWFYDAVEFSTAKGFFSGYKSGKFGPSDNITRQDFVLVLARIDGVDLTQYNYKSGFKDVARGSYYEAAVNWANSMGISTGYNPTTFGVGDSINREQLVTMLYRYAVKKGYDVTGSADASSKLTQFADAKRVSSFAKEAVVWALDCGVIKGLNATSVGPQGSAARAQAAQILTNICDNDVLPF